jgi:hypothetical protein
MFLYTFVLIEKYNIVMGSTKLTSICKARHFQWVLDVSNLGLKLFCPFVKSKELVRRNGNQYFSSWSRAEWGNMSCMKKGSTPGN